ncbi:MAG: Fic family protein [Lachnospiraceae bacterium]|nr:Fic family protein [Lachnospiraceae bacterium]
MNLDMILERSFEELSSEDEAQIVAILKEAFRLEWKANDRKGIYAKTQKMMAYNSNKIEGSTLTSEQTASLFDTGTLYSDGTVVYRAKDIEEMTGHFSMFNYMIQTLGEPFSEEMLKQFHFHLKTGVFEDMANGYPVGEYKRWANAVSDLNTALPKEVPEKMRNLILSYEEATPSIESIARFHAEYELIHPFQDGNGRTGRMVLFRQCLDAGIVPIIIKDEHKLDYYHALHAAQVEKDTDALVSFFKGQQKLYYEALSCYLVGYEYRIQSQKARNTIL